ncbi:MAG TPA: 30S ribosomal protein S16 [Candidatus Paceibacterota bacterium]|nr:30S ribosomal protein S16 [Candidatus Paceibacterota bacterium]
MLTIRLFRTGKKNQPSFKIVVTDKRRSSTRGRFVEEVGFYNPLTKQRNLKGDRVKYWISVGAQPSATVHNMLVADKVIEGTKIAKHKLVPAKAEAAPAEAPAVAEKPAEAPQTPQEEPKAEEPKPDAQAPTA